MTKGGSFKQGQTNPYCPAATSIVLSVPLLSNLRLSTWLGVAPSTLTRWAERCGVNVQRRVVRSIKPCGHGCCVAAIRVVWSDDIPKNKLGKWLGVEGSTATRWAIAAGLDPCVNARPPKTISAKAIRDAWMDRTITAAEASRRVGLSTRALYDRSIGMGLPPRKSGVLPKEWPADFDAMWRAGVTVREMARICHRASPSHITIEAQRRGLPKRGSGYQKEKITIDQLPEAKLRMAMEERAKAEREIWRRANMVDVAQEQRNAA